MTRLLEVLRLVLPTAAAVLFSTAASAAVLFAQSPLEGGEAFEAQFSIVEDFGFQNAESYVLSAASSVSGIRWWGSEVSDTDPFVVRRFDDLVAAPDVFDTLAGTVQQTATGLVDSIDAPVFQFDLTLDTPLVFAPSAYLSVLFDSDQKWYWLESGTGDGESAFRGVTGDPWDFAPPDLALAVIGPLQTVPEPPALALLLAVAAGAGIAGSRKNRGPSAVCRAE